MQIGVVSTALADLDFEVGLTLLERLGVQAIEIGCAGFHTNHTYGHLDELVADRGKRDRWTEALASRQLEVSALSIHGEPLSPDREVASEYSRQFRQACELAQAIGVNRLTLLAGLPEGAPGDRCPCWATTAFPPYVEEVRRWQWEARVVPYWAEHARIADSHGCRLCFEMHPADVVYNPASMARLREAVGPVAGCNFDPSHLFWQGIDPLEALRWLGDAVYHVHAKDTGIQSQRVRLNGVLDPTPFADLPARAWAYRTIGYGHDAMFWRDFVTTLRLIGYEDVISIEHEDEYIDSREGLVKAVAFLRPLTFRERRSI